GATLEQPAGLIVEYGREGGPLLTVESPSEGREHLVPISRLAPGESYRFEARAVGGGRTGEPVAGAFTTPPLPAAVEEGFRVTRVEGRASFDLIVLEGRGIPHDPLILDTRGEVVWYDPFDAAGSY